MGESTDAATTRARMRVLQNEFLVPTHSPRDGQPRARSTKAQAPVDVRIVDHMAASLAEIITDAEIVAHTRPVDAPPGHATAQDDDVYGWAIDQIGHAEHIEPARQQYLDTVIYRQGLEHAVLMGNDLAIRRHACPQCGCWGLFWRAAARNAGCVNRRCTDPHGRPTSWSLHQLAAQHIKTAEKSSRRRAT